jgi:hypothetical protein
MFAGYLRQLMGMFLVFTRSPLSVSFSPFPLSPSLPPIPVGCNPGFGPAKPTKIYTHTCGKPVPSSEGTGMATESPRRDNPQATDTYNTMLLHVRIFMAIPRACLFYQV